jgi:hypothetical protein
LASTKKRTIQQVDEENEENEEATIPSKISHGKSSKVKKPTRRVLKRQAKNKK